MPSSELDYQETIQRSRFFQTIQAWPLDDDLNYEGWLDNFKKGEEQTIACSILDFFVHYPSRMVNKILMSLSLPIFDDAVFAAKKNRHKQLLFLLLSSLKKAPEQR